MRSPLWKLGLVGTAAGSLLGLVAVTPPSGAASNKASHGVAEAKALLKKYSKNPKYVSPGPSVDVSKLSGKSVFNLPASSSVPFVAAVDKDLGAYAQDLGIKYVDYPNQQQESQWQQGMGQAVTDKASVINLITGIPPEQLAPQIQQAKSAGIPTVDVGERNSTQPTVTYVSSYVFAPFKQAGQLMGAWAVAQTKGKAHVLIVTSNADTSSAAVQTGVTSEIKKTCPSCKISTVNSNPTTWATKLQTTIEGELAAHPTINYVLPVFDSMSLFIAPAITAAQKDGKVFIASYNGTPSILKMMETGNIVTMDVGEDPAEVALAGLDADLRLMAGMSPGKEVVSSKVFTKANVHETGSPIATTKGYGSAFVKGYAKTWGVSESKLKLG